MYWRVYAIRYIVLSYMLVATPVVEFQDFCQLYVCVMKYDGVTIGNLRSIYWWVELLCILSKGFQNGSLDVTLCNLRSIQIFIFYFCEHSDVKSECFFHNNWPYYPLIWYSDRVECLMIAVNRKGRAGLVPRAVFGSLIGFCWLISKTIAYRLLLRLKWTWLWNCNDCNIISFILNEWNNNYIYIYIYIYISE